MSKEDEENDLAINVDDDGDMHVSFIIPSGSFKRLVAWFLTLLTTFLGGVNIVQVFQGKQTETPPTEKGK